MTCSATTQARLSLMNTKTGTNSKITRIINCIGIEIPPSGQDVTGSIKLKATKETIGILNLYELMRETFNDHHKRGFIGYNIGQPYRRKYYATEAVKQLIQYTRNQHDLNKLVAHLKKENTTSRDFLLKLGFVNCTEEYYYSDKYDYYELQD